MTRRGIKRTMRLHVKCPNCREPMFGTKTEVKTETFTEVTYECRNPTCGARFVYAVHGLRMLSPPHVLINTSMDIKLSPLLAKTMKLMNHFQVSDDETDLKMIEEAMPKDDMFRMLAANDAYGTPPRPPDKPRLKEFAHNSS